MQYERDNSIQREVRKTLNWDKQQWTSYQYESGLWYLEKLMPEYPQVARQISASPIFWNWWKAHWEDRDKQYLEQIELAADDKIIDPVAEYQELHDARTLAAAIYLSGQVLMDSYAAMIGKITDQQLKEVA